MASGRPFKGFPSGQEISYEDIAHEGIVIEIAKGVVRFKHEPILTVAVTVYRMASPLH